MCGSDKNEEPFFFIKNGGHCLSEIYLDKLGMIFQA